MKKVGRMRRTHTEKRRHHSRRNERRMEIVWGHESKKKQIRRKTLAERRERYLE